MTARRPCSCAGMTLIGSVEPVDDRLGVAELEATMVLRLESAVGAAPAALPLDAHP
jgi:hypothetical protein